jgi:hypothetical protein
LSLGQPSYNKTIEFFLNPAPPKAQSILPFWIDNVDRVYNTMLNHFEIAMKLILKMKRKEPRIAVVKDKLGSIFLLLFMKISICLN